ncbi:copper resistance system multicopper oxidase [uncultured Acinetobacter sp.]|uniref:copper resistance system multicopper oxidase n=1 Tax=uncultured Acinetobacter sp. TaxID=165433 RepID=UPI002584CBD0|nr:copper resistance system multicopper oxidase [uncultured Acinetobacter sp.]
MKLKLPTLWFAAMSLVLSSAASAAVKTYHLTIDQHNINLNGKSVSKITVNGQFPAPLLEFNEGDEAVIHVHNNLKKEQTALHWHGLLLPGLMDGVPGFNGFQGIHPNGDFVYRFRVRQNGTYWYHAHSKGQEQDGLYGPLIIYPKPSQHQDAAPPVQRDYVVMLSDSHPTRGDQILKNLKKDAEFYQNRRETWSDVWQQVKHEGVKATWQDRKMWNQMRMLKTDLSDVSGYTFLVNGKAPDQNWTGQFLPGERIRLRFINAAAMSFFDVRIPNLKMTVVAADGQPVQPVSVDEFRIGAAETYDVVVQPQHDAYQIQAESIDRTGFALASLINKNATHLKAFPAPVARPRTVLTMQDMGHAHMSTSAQAPDMHTTEHDSMPMQEDHAHMQHMPMASMDQQHDLHMQHMMQNDDTRIQGWSNAATPKGMKALSYADLRARTPQTDLRAPDREIEIRLGGTMERYIWTMNGQKFSEAKPLQVKYGERVRLKFINESMMAHPMHLHGMFVQLENGQAPENLPNKHTIIVPPGQTVSALLTADEVGEWAIHCHLLYHMSAGMMNKLIVAHTDYNSDTASSASSVAELVPTPSQGAHHAHH